MAVKAFSSTKLVVLQRCEQIEAAGEVAGVDQFVLERAPRPFDESVVGRAARPC